MTFLCYVFLERFHFTKLELSNLAEAKLMKFHLPDLPTTSQIKFINLRSISLKQKKDLLRGPKSSNHLEEVFFFFIAGYNIIDNFLNFQSYLGSIHQV